MILVSQSFLFFEANITQMELYLFLEQSAFSGFLRGTERHVEWNGMECLCCLARNPPHRDRSYSLLSISGRSGRLGIRLFWHKRGLSVNLEELTLLKRKMQHFHFIMIYNGSVRLIVPGPPPLKLFYTSRVMLQRKAFAHMCQHHFHGSGSASTRTLGQETRRSNCNKT